MKNLDVVILVLVIISLALTAYSTFAGKKGASASSVDNYAPPRKSKPIIRNRFVGGLVFGNADGNIIEVSRDGRTITFYPTSYKAGLGPMLPSQVTMYKVLQVQQNDELYVGQIVKQGSDDKLLFSYDSSVDDKYEQLKIQLVSSQIKAVSFNRVPTAQQLLRMRLPQGKFSNGKDSIQIIGNKVIAKKENQRIVLTIYEYDSNFPTLFGMKTGDLRTGGPWLGGVQPDASTGKISATIVDITGSGMVIGPLPRVQ